MSTSSIKRQTRSFHVVVVQWTSKKCTKKRDTRAEPLFWSLNLLFFEVVFDVVVVVVAKAPYFYVLWMTRTQENDFLFPFLNFDIVLIRIQLPQNLPTLDKLNEME